MENPNPNRSNPAESAHSARYAARTSRDSPARREPDDGDRTEAPDADSPLARLLRPVRSGLRAAAKSSPGKGQPSPPAAPVKQPDPNTRPPNPNRG